MRLTTLLAALIASLALPAMPVAAESPFSPRLVVDGRPITNFEFEQRRLLLEVLRAPGDLDKLAETQLVEDRLKQEAAHQLGITVSADEVKTATDEFAKQANMTGDEFVTELGKAGVEPQTFRDFISINLLWRDVVRTKFVGTFTISDAEIDRAISTTSKRGQLRALLSEIVLPLAPGISDQNIAVAQRIAGELQHGADFAAYAQKYSVSATAANGGALDWMPLGSLPGELSGMVLKMHPGQVSDPVILPNAVIILKLRSIDEDVRLAASEIEVDYAQYLIPGGRSAAALAEAAKIEARVDTCEDLYPIARAAGPSRLTRTTEVLSKVPPALAAELAGLDPHEMSTALTRGDNLVLLMLCSRDMKTAEPTDREAIRQVLTNQRLQALAEIYVARLKAAAYIRTP